MTEENAHNAQVGIICGMLGMAWVIICSSNYADPLLPAVMIQACLQYSPIYDDPQQPIQK